MCLERPFDSRVQVECCVSGLLLRSEPTARSIINSGYTHLEFILARHRMLARGDRIMPDEIRRIDYYSVSVLDKPGAL